ncbi:hypothetical protein FACS1894151_10290 [Spirochaetia bacterium]|nr:hypothetical protein FACS1894151_10290 [Spirochaetia bacterium]
MKKRIAVLGATGSIGHSTLDVLRNDPDSFETVLLTANNGREKLLALGREFPSARIALSGDDKAENGEIRRQRQMGIGDTCN